MGKYLVFLLLLVSCANPKKLHRMMDNLPEATAKECADRFPIKETVETVTIVDSALLRQYEIEFQYMAQMIDSLLIESCDTVYQDKIIEIIKNIPGKPQVRQITKIQENTAKQQVILDSCQKVSSLLYKKLDICDKKTNELVVKCDRYRRERNQYLWLLIALIIFSFRRKVGQLLKII
jgi:hypothetical protein